MRVAIVGSRDYDGPGRVRAYVSRLDPGTVVVSGGARGVDRQAARLARRAGLEVVEWRVFDRQDGWYTAERWVNDVFDTGSFRPDGRPWAFRSFGRAAFHRNGLIVQEADLVVAFWDGESKGTKMTIDLADEAGKETVVFNALLNPAL